MHKLATALALSLMVLAAFGRPASAGLAEAGELEAARANARAGGPTSERDKELLERWGCSSGTDSAFCRRLSHRDDTLVARRVHRRHVREQE